MRSSSGPAGTVCSPVNPRSPTRGMRLLARCATSILQVARRGLQAFFYQLVTGAEGEAPSFTHHADVLTSLRARGLLVESHWERCASIDAVIAFCESAGRMRVARCR